MMMKPQANVQLFEKAYQDYIENVLPSLNYISEIWSELVGEDIGGICPMIEKDQYGNPRLLGFHGEHWDYEDCHNHFASLDEVLIWLKNSETEMRNYIIEQKVEQRRKKLEQELKDTIQSYRSKLEQAEKGVMHKEMEREIQSFRKKLQDSL